MLDLSDHADLAVLSQVIRDVQQASPGIDCMLVGAFARDLRLTYAYDIPVARRTSDIDLALAVKGWGDFKAMKERMEASRLFTPTAALQRMLHVSNVPLDLIPYGDIEGPGNRIEWPPHGDIRSRVPGYREARAAADIIRLPNHVDVYVATLSGLLILKLFAFEDRALTEPRKDAGDIHFILRNYTDAGNQERLFTEYPHLVEVQDFDYAVAGAQIAGYDLRRVLTLGAQPSAILEQLGSLLTSELEEQNPARLLSQVAPQFFGEFRNLLIAFTQTLLS